ncbi:MAG: GNAT family N-acetyltransferase [Acidimicrobiales bacterium]
MAKDQRLVAEITELINVVYADAEAGLWVDGAARTTTTEMEDLIASNQIALAQTDDEMVGCIRIQQLDGTVGEFGMLAAHPERRGDGIGRDLVRFAEELSYRRGLTIMQLELLVPREWSHPSKVFLHDWYTRIGYRPVRTGIIEEAYPQLAPLLATPCDFVVYHKPLSAAGSAARPDVRSR